MAPKVKDGHMANNPLTVAQRELLADIRHLIEQLERSPAGLVRSDSSGEKDKIEDEAIAVMVKLVDRRWTEFVRERAAPPEAPARH